MGRQSLNCSFGFLANGRYKFSLVAGAGTPLRYDTYHPWTAAEQTGTIMFHLHASPPLTNDEKDAVMTSGQPEIGLPPSPLILNPVTAGFTSIDRFPQDTAPIFCLPFDGIGARHPGTAGAGSWQ